MYDCTADGSNARDNLYRIVEKCNAHTVDLNVSIHLNCFNGRAHGTETLVRTSGSKAKKYAEQINNNIVALGYTNRGIKYRTDLYVLNKTKAPALLVETFFCDSKDDCARYKKQGVHSIALTIADGICKERISKKIKSKIVEKVTRNKNIDRIYRVLPP